MSETKPPAEPSTGTMSAIDAALAATSESLTADNLGDYRKAWAAERQGEPLPAVARPGVLSEDEFQQLKSRQDAGDYLTDAERTSLRRTQKSRQQDRVNEGARRAAQRVLEDHQTALKAKDDEIARLRRDLATSPVPRVPAQAEAASTGRPVAVPAAKPASAATSATTEAAPDPNDTQKYPAGVYDPQYIEDRALYRLEQKQAATRETETQERRRVAAEEGWTRAKLDFTQRIAEAQKTDTDLAEALASDLASKHLVPVEEFERLKAANVLPANAQPEPIHFLASYIVGQSKIGEELIKYFHKNPAELDRVLASGPQELYLVEATLRAKQPPSSSSETRPPAPAPSRKTVTDATPPVTHLGRREAPPPDEKEAAITASSGGGVSDGVADYNRRRREELAAERKAARSR